MPWKIPARLARLRLKIRSLIVLVAIIATGLGIWREYWSPRRVWRRAIHAPKIERVEEISIWGHKNVPPRHVFERSIFWPIHQLRIRGLDESESLEELELAMVDPDASIRREVYCLVANEPSSLTPPVAVRLLAPGLGDREEIVRAASVRGLGVFIIPDDPLARKFFGMLDDPSPLVRRCAVYSSCAMIARVRDATTPSRDRLIAAVLSRLDDPDPLVRAATIDAVEYLLKHDRRLGDPERAGMNGGDLLDALESKLGDPKSGIRAMAAFVLASHGRGLDAAPMLVELASQQARLEGPDGLYPSVGSWYPSQSLILLADRSEEATSFLFSRLGVIDTGDPSGTWRLLARVASRSPEARSRIERIAIRKIAFRHPYVQAQLALILQEIGSSRDVLTELVEGSISNFDHIRRDSIQALKARLAFDPRVLPRLREATKDPIEYNATQAAKALKAVEAMPTQPLPGGEP